MPDGVPVIGYVDDVAVIAWVAKALRDELARFREWERGEPT
ncbi:MAG: DUF1232 domain-containing protein [Candidatus Aureabacteria bacterium]|nr:DUF1232 domain-containing protein [Candidatus Auribacterota bacterium]